MKRTRLVAVGGCAVDTILQVPHFPKQDSKLRATSLTKRRGGNCPNSLEVLQQLTHREHARHIMNRECADRVTMPELYLIVTLPSRTSPQIPFILSSFDLLTRDEQPESQGDPQTPTEANSPKIDFTHCMYRESKTEPFSSYIISDQSTGSRTIVSHNDLQEMSLDEFTVRADNILCDTNADMQQDIEVEQIWFHFEGRIPSTTLECIRYLRLHPAVTGNSSRPATVDLKISVEIEKPYREGLQELTHEADVILYSRSWAEAEGYTSAAECLKAQSAMLGFTNYSAGHCKRTLVCTWGDRGASALTLPCPPRNLDATIVSGPAFGLEGKKVVDTVGAGDTFIAGILFGFLCRDDGAPGDAWSLRQKLDFANELAGRKVIQHGFAGLGEQVKGLVDVLDQMTKTTKSVPGT